ncbi:hypothetical protein C0V78_13470 [Novosphingobium sp. TH158]|nr:hypothetical protein C0V78_13470 [Novosphingobium sp. TH158]
MRRQGTESSDEALRRMVVENAGGDRLQELLYGYPCLRETAALDCHDAFGHGADVRQVRSFVNQRSLLA